MNDSKDKNPNGAWLFYDGECPICRRWVERLRRPLSKHHFQFVAQQSELAQKKLGLNPGEIFPEMKVITADGILLGGADAALHVARFLWWARPFPIFAKFPGGLAMMRRVYASLAARRYCGSGKCNL